MENKREIRDAYALYIVECTLMDVLRNIKQLSDTNSFLKGAFSSPETFSLRAESFLDYVLWNQHPFDNGRGWNNLERLNHPEYLFTYFIYFLCRSLHYWAHATSTTSAVATAATSARSSPFVVVCRFASEQVQSVGHFEHYI